MLGSWKPELGRSVGSERVRVSSGLLVTYVPVPGRFHYVGGTSYVDSKFAVFIHHLHGPSAKPLGLCGLGSRVVSVLDSGAEGPGFKSQPRRCRVYITVLGKLFTPIVPLFTVQRNW